MFIVEKYKGTHTLPSQYTNLNELLKWINIARKWWCSTDITSKPQYFKEKANNSTGCHSTHRARINYILGFKSTLNVFVSFVSFLIFWIVVYFQTFGLLTKTISFKGAYCGWSVIKVTEQGNKGKAVMWLWYISLYGIIQPDALRLWHVLAFRIFKLRLVFHHQFQGKREEFIQVTLTTQIVFPFDRPQQ